MSGNALELDAETMRRLGYQAVDLLVDRISNLDSQPAWLGASRAVLEERLRRPAPHDGRPFDELVGELTSSILPYAARVDHPRFLAYVGGAPTWPGVLADLLAAGYNIFQGTWLGSSGPSAVELIVVDWFRQWLGMPETAGGLFLSGGSAANLTALACARLARFGAHEPRAVVYFSEEAHSSVERAARVLGFAADRVRIVPTDDSFALRMDALEARVAADLADGLLPFAVIANAGSTSTGAVDPLVALSAFCRERGIWLHVDAAYGGFAVLTQRGRELLTGLEQADSVTLDPHKLLYQPFEAGCLIVRDAELLERSFRVMPVYLQDTAVRAEARHAVAAEDGVNFGERGIQLTRSPRALKVWLSLQYFGLDAFREAIERTMTLARHAETRIRESAALELLTPASFGIVCFRRRTEGDAGDRERANARIVKALAESGVGLISSTRVRGEYALRLCVLSHRTQAGDIDRVLRWLDSAPTDQPEFNL